MCKVILFAGTTEGRVLAEFLSKRNIEAHVCVATEYGGELLPDRRALEISGERLDEAQMEALFTENDCPLVIDATHPYAAEVTRNIKKACEASGAEYVRVLRDNEAQEENADCVYVESVEEAVAFLETTQGNILATTGSKEAHKYTALPDYRERVFLRVLSLPDVVEQCAEQGFQGKNLIAMQGPFSKEMNAAMLRRFSCRYLVTKMSGTSGGFREKLEAARECGCTPVIIGRPLRESGISVNECKRILCEKFALESRADISLVGIGMGSRDSRTVEAETVLREAQLLIGAKRMTDSVGVRSGQDIYNEYDSEKIASYIENHPEYEKIAIVLSGDVGFYSGARKLTEKLGENVRIVCGVSSAAYFMSRIGKSWDDALLVSAHGKEVSMIPLIKSHRKVFAILGSRDGISTLAQKLMEFGMENVTVYTGERLSYADEKVQHGKPADFIGYEADTLSVVCIENEEFTQYPATHGIKDEAFLRDQVPMTKEEIRTVSLSKLRLTENSVCYDVGAGTGSVAVEMALRVPYGKVYAIEKKPQAVELLKKNRLKFAAENMKIINGTAPEVLETIEDVPTHAFIGGSSGNMRAILNALLACNPSIRIVINCIALETATEALQCLNELPFAEKEIVQLSVSRSENVGSYHMMMGENPIYIISCTGNGGES